MFETLFTYPAVLARHQTRPGSAQRGRYLAHSPAKALLARPCCVLLASCLWLLSGLM